ncbi:hypothetical protein HII31_06130 [Pseudocercospora fuligena]|uniref:DUF6603 domain-containing protein n=1 Tax=Pseudocercospora fuligena TaxID=685502 RepID=A0A8H6VLK1_9PEZI|nr:hypothetical protein HII31_06130 [Pseudocercospora fuligena]
MADSSTPQPRTLQQIQALTNKTDAEIYTSDLNLTVDVYHINVESEGDSAVHLLVHQDDKFTKGVVLRAVLIDAGMPAKEDSKTPNLKGGAPKIRAFLEKIGTIYDFDSQQGGRTKPEDQLKWPPFDSIVITHWDRDHYGGMRPLLSGPLFEWDQANKPEEPKVKAKPKGKKRKTDTSADDAAAEKKARDVYIAKLKAFTESYLSPYMKYKQPTTSTSKVDGKDVTTTSTARADRALTVLYCPYWGPTAASHTSNEWNSSNPSSFFAALGRSSTAMKDLGYDTDAKLLKLWNPHYDGDAAAIQAAEDADGPNLPTRFLNFCVKQTGFAFQPPEVIVKKLCKIRAGNDNLLGTNLFTGWRLSATQCALIKNPLFLALGHVNAKSYMAAPSPADACLNTVTAADINDKPAQPAAKAQPVMLLVAANGVRCGPAFTEEKKAEQKVEAARLLAVQQLEEARKAGKPTEDLEKAAASTDDFKDEEPSTELETELTPQDQFANWVKPEPMEIDDDKGKDSRNTEDKVIENKAFSPKRLDRPKTGTLPKFQIKVVNKQTADTASELTNRASIITMTVWTDGHISHYSAGDAQWELEDSIVDWIRLGKNPYQCVRAVKLSHHGSEYSTPLDLVRKFRPRSIVIPAAKNSHGHPVYELLLYLNRWFRTTNRIVPCGTSPSKLVHPMGYPYYLARTAFPDDAMELDDKADTADDATKNGNTAKDDGEKDDAMKDDKTNGSNTDDKEDESHTDDKKDAAAAPIEFNYIGFGGKENLYGPLLSLIDDAVTSPRRVFMQALQALEARFPDLADRAVERFVALELQLASKAKKTPLWDLNEKRNFLFEETESAMKVVADWLPETYPGISVADKSFGTMFSATEKVQWVKVCCRSIDPSRRQKSLDKWLDGYTETQKTTFVPNAKSTEKKKSSRPAGATRVVLDARTVRSEKAKHDAVMEELLAKALNRDRENLSVGLRKQLNNAEAESGRLANVLKDLDAGKMPEAKKGENRPKRKREPPPENKHVVRKLMLTRALAVATVSATPAGAEPPQPVASAEPDLWRLVPASLLPSLTVSSDASVVPIDEKQSDYEYFLMWTKQKLVVVDKDGDFDVDDSFKNHLFNAIGTAGTPSLRAIFAQDTEVTGGKWQGLNLSFQHAGHQLAFETTSALSYFGATFELGLNYSVPESGIVVPRRLLALGLANAELNQKWKFSHVLTWFWPTSPETTDALSALEDAIGANVEFALRRAAIWFVPSDNYAIVQRMEWELQVGALTKWLGDGFMKLDTVTILSPTIVGRKITRHTRTGAGELFSDAYEILVSLVFQRKSTNEKMTAAIEVDLEEGSTTLTISLLPEKGNLGDMLGWINELLGNSDETINSVANWIRGVGVSVKRIQLGCSKTGISSFVVDVEWLPGWKDKVSADPAVKPIDVPLWLTYRYNAASKPNPHSITAQVWFEPPGLRVADAVPTEISPYFEPVRVIRPISPAPASVHLQSLMPGDYKLPSELDLEIAELVVKLDGRTVSFSGVLQASDDDGTDGGFGIRLERVTISASYERAEASGPATGASETPKPKGPASYSLFLEAEIDLLLDDDDLDDNSEFEGLDDDDVVRSDRALLVASISLESIGGNQTCLLHGSVTDLNFGMLGRFFPDEDRAIVTDILGHIEIKALDIDYLYDSTGVASSFDIGATLLLGPCELDLDFHRDNDGWQFDALLQAAGGTNATVGAILQDILGDDKDAMNNVPDFITKLSLAGGDAFVSFQLVSIDSPTPSKAASGADPVPAVVKYLMMDLTMRLPVPGGAGIEFSFTQLMEKPPLPTAPAKAVPPLPGAARSKTKRIIKIAVTDLPWHKIPNPPVVGKIEPMFDELQFLWIQDPVSNKGITRQEVMTLKEVTVLQFKETFRQPKPVDIVLTSGMHFCVADASALMLDYAFNKPKAAPVDADGKVVASKAVTNSINKDGSARRQPAPGAPVNSASGEGTATGELSKKVGPLTVANVGLRFEDNNLILFLDIAAHLGPVQVMLLGLGFGINLKTFNLQKPDEIEPKFELKGMGISFDQPPVGLAGMFKDASTKTQRLYMGGIAVSFKPYSFMAVGEYGEVSRNGQDMSDTFKTLFVFAKLEGPLIELEFITIGGITLGFGYNSNLRFPKIEEVSSFPFIANTVGGENADPLTVMNQLVGSADSYVKPQEDSFWIAAGLQAKAFQVLDVSAVVILEFNPYVNLGIFAKAIAQMPPAPTPRIACFLYVELGLMCTVDFHKGEFRVEALLSPNSFVIHPSCHLTGGFALCYWWAPSQYAGDFVFTVGGYHPMFKPPSHYPIPPRLGISWELGPVSIRGEAYFAITPKCCMGGGRLEAVFNAGLLCAFFTAYADFLIVYHPFFFMGDIGVSVGVRFTLDILFVTIHISVTLGARLHLQGPEFGGVAHVDFWVFGFDIPFGARPKRPDALTLDAFSEFLLQVPDGDAVTASAIEGSPSKGGKIDKLHVLSVEDGRFPNKAGAKDSEVNPGEIWEVKRAGFVFRIQSRVPLQSLTEVKDADSVTLATPTAFYSTPMQLKQQLVSAMTVKIGKVEKNGQFEWEKFMPTAITKSVPKALWDIYDENTDPTTGNTDTSKLVSNTPGDGTMDLMMGATFSAPLPFRSQDKVVKFNVLLSSSLDVFTEDDRKNGAIPTLPRTHKTASANTRSQQPASGAKQWDAVKSTWMKASQQTQKDDDSGETVRSVDLAIDVWSQALGWSSDNAMKNDLGAEKDTFIWQQFDQLYMAAPMLSPVA